eukprot:TRINITY_DN3204_c0_g1_i7.p1 TRINITY_DN3204_c0_g1~~TRINITY_DN3204_c0_g1_i7.p1  ORF type:complete len:531 (-),score=60.84 TRINITY_DN3204_c0_g1_i7:331-1923(-)
MAALRVIVLVFIIAIFSDSANCDCVSYKSPSCGTISGDLVFVPNGLSAEYLESAAQQSIDQFRSISYVDTDCYANAVSYVCLSAFVTCSNISGTIIPSPSCKSVCEEANSVCSPFFQQLSFSFNCTALPVDVITDPIPRNCSTPLSSDIDYPACPDPGLLARPPEGGACTSTCIFKYYEDDQEDFLGDLTDAFSWLSFWCSIVLIATFLIFPSKTEFPQNMTLCLGISSLGTAIGQLLSLLPTEEVKCIDVVTVADGTVPYCVLQGVLMQYFPLSIACWWLCISLNLFLTIVKDYKNGSSLLKYYHGFSWGFPALLTLIALGGLDYVYLYDGFNICSLNTREKLDGLFIVWFIIIGFFGICLLSAVIYRLYQAIVYTTSDKSVKKISYAQMRTFFFLLYYLIESVCVVSLTYMSRYLRDKILGDLEDYFVCIFGFTSTPFSDCSYTPVISFYFVTFTKSIVFGQGVVLCIIFLTTWDTYECYHSLMKNGVTSLRRSYETLFRHNAYTNQVDISSLPIDHRPSDYVAVARD